MIDHRIKGGKCSLKQMIDKVMHPVGTGAGPGATDDESSDVRKKREGLHPIGAGT